MEVVVLDPARARMERMVLYFLVPQSSELAHPYQAKPIKFSKSLEVALFIELMEVVEAEEIVKAVGVVEVSAWEELAVLGVLLAANLSQESFKYFKAIFSQVVQYSSASKLSLI